MSQKNECHVEYSVARSRDDLEQAFRLVYREYERRSYIAEHRKSMLYLSLFNALPSSTTFIAKRNGKVLATVTLIPDSPLGIPMDVLYKKEVDSLRTKKHRIAEVSELAIDSSLFPRGCFSLFHFRKLLFILRLFKVLFDYARKIEHITELCISVNPKHQCLYNILFFEKLGGLKHYPAVNHAPAIARHLTIDNSLRDKSKQQKAIYTLFYRSDIDLHVYKNKLRLTARDIEYFFMQKTDVLKAATSKQLLYLQLCYPQLRFSTCQEKPAKS